mgnify:CR=1 FL=1
MAPSDLIALLRDVRSEMASKHAVPAYVIASNKTLEDMARLRLDEGAPPEAAGAELISPPRDEVEKSLFVSLPKENSPYSSS